MKTASYFTYPGPGRIGITVGMPRRIPAGFRMYRPLAPRREMLELPFNLYQELYLKEILGPLDPAVVKADLEELAGAAEPVLLCFERPPFNADNWCHRRMVAKWFKVHLDLDVPEIGYDGPDH